MTYVRKIGQAMTYARLMHEEMSHARQSSGEAQVGFRQAAAASRCQTAKQGLREER